MEESTKPARPLTTTDEGKEEEEEKPQPKPKYALRPELLKIARKSWENQKAVYMALKDR